MTNPRRRWTRQLAVTVVTVCLSGCGSDVGEQNREVVVPADAINVLATPDAITRVVDLEPTEDGRIWILNSQPPYFVVVGQDGEVERQFGAQGGGPQEFDRPVAVVGLPGSSDVWVYDWVRNALIEITADSRRVVPLPRDTIPVPSLVSFKGAGINPAPPWLESDEEGFLFARARTPYPESALHLWNAEVLRVSRDETHAVELVAPLVDYLGAPQSEYGAATLLMPYPLWSLCPNGSLGLYDPLSGVLRRFEAGGGEVAPLDLPAPNPVAVTPDLVFEMFFRQFAEDRPGSQGPDMEDMRRLTEGQNREFVQNSSPDFPVYSELHCDARGRFWLRRFDPTVGRLGMGPDWLQVALDGTYSLISLPSSFRVFRIEHDRMWGTLRDELGVESVASYDVSAQR